MTQQRIARTRRRRQRPTQLRPLDARTGVAGLQEIDDLLARIARLLEAV